MPILGLSDQTRLPRLGKIHLGVKVAGKGGVEYPKAVDYFVCPDEVKAVYGEKPIELDIMFPTEDPDLWASQFYRAYSKTRGLICKGDGVSAIRMVDAETGAIATSGSKSVEMKQIGCEGKDCPEYTQFCRPIMNLQFILPHVAGLGVYQIDTSSINSIINMNSMVKLVKATMGRVSMIPLKLRLIEHESQDDKGKKRINHVLQIATDKTMTELVRLPLPEVGKGILPESDDEVPELLLPDNQRERVEAQQEQEPEAETAEQEQEVQPAQQESAIPTKEAEESVETPTDLRQFLTWCNKQYGLMPSDVARLLEIEKVDKKSVANLKTAWWRVKQVMKEIEEAGDA